MVSLRVLGASLALALVWSGCGDAEGTGLEEPVDADSGASGAGGRPGAGSDGTNGGRSGNDGGESGGASDGGGASNGGSTAGDAGSGPDSGGPGTGPSAGCGQAPAFQSGTFELDVDGLTRTFIVDVPSDYSEDEPYPIVFGFHGRDFSAAEFRSEGYGDLLSAAGDAAILVHPDATEAGAWELTSQVDIRFFDAMLDRLSQGLCVDEARVFATGHSSGGYFSNVLGCQRADVLRGIAPVAGGGPVIDGEQPTCQGPVSAWIAHGEEDPTVPFSEGEGSLEWWLGSDDCDVASAESVDPDRCEAYSCSDGVSVHWCPHAGGHDWPGFAAAGIWSFFESL